MTLPGLPDFITAGSLEWATTVLAVGAGLLCIRLLYLSRRCDGVSLRAYAIGLLAVFATAVVVGLPLFGLLSSRQ